MEPYAHVGWVEVRDPSHNNPKSINPRTAPTLTRNAFSDRGGFRASTDLAFLLQQTQLVPEDNVAERMIGFAFDH